MPFPPRYLLLFSLCVAACLALTGMDKKKNKPYSELPVIQSKDADQPTQVLPPPKEPPAAVLADTSRLEFSAIPLSAKGLLSQQTREAMRALVRSSRGSTILRIRAFVAGSGDVRRVQEIAGEVFGEKHTPLPAFSVVQAGALPLQAAQISLEVISAGRRDANPYGLGFFSAQIGNSVAQSASHLAAEMSKAGLQPSDALRVTCYVNSFDAAGDWKAPLAVFSQAAVTAVQMLREPVGPQAACDAVARLRAVVDPPVKFLDPVSEQSSAVLVSAPQIVLSGLQMAFGQKEDDVRQSYERLDKALSAFHAGFESAVTLDNYLLFGAVVKTSAAVRAELSTKGRAPAATVLPFEGLPSLDATLGIDVAAIPRS